MIMMIWHPLGGESPDLEISFRSLDSRIAGANKAVYLK
jgi:hypothetical protein